jgi:hypothetical protein
MIDHHIISPINLKKLHKRFWRLLALPGKPLNYFDLRNQQNGTTAQTLGNFYDQWKALFPPPRLVVQQNFDLAGFNLVPGNVQIPVPPPPPP